MKLLTILAFLSVCPIGCGGDASHVTTATPGTAPKSPQQPQEGDDAPKHLRPFNHRPALRSVKKRLAAGDHRALAAESMDAMLVVAGRLLRDRGLDQMALEMEGDWRDLYRGAMTGEIQDTGDHPPLSQWVQDLYKKLEDALGVQLMEMSHLRDIWVLNFTIPVVFYPQASEFWCAQDLALHKDDTCKAEYRRHFAGTKYYGPDPYATAALHHGFSGVVTYWIVWGICEASTYGTGWFVICTPAGDLAEYVLEKYAAPQLSDKVYDKANG